MTFVACSARGASSAGAGRSSAAATRYSAASLIAATKRGKSPASFWGNSEAEAAARLRQVLTEIESGGHVRPSEAARLPLPRGQAPRLRLRQVVNDFLAEKRKVRGRRTAANYLSRLRPVLDFAERPAALKRWPLAADVGREFVVELRAALHRRQTTRNGRPGGRPRALSGRQVVNVLECLRSVLAWARRAEVRKLPAEWANPLTHDLVGGPPAKDPLREDKLPLGARVRLAAAMDRWQLCRLGPSLVLPMRPGEAAGLLIADVNFERGWLESGRRLGDCNFTKGKTAFTLPFPDELRPVLRACVAGRAEGPLLRGRKSFEKGGGAGVASLDELRLRYEEVLLGQPRDSAQSAHDRKRLFRRLLRELGGVSEDELSRELKRLLARRGVGGGAAFYALRGSVTTALKAANLPHLEMRYLTSDSTGDILNEYATLDPVGAMRRYLDTIRPLLAVIADRAAALGLAGRRSTRLRWRRTCWSCHASATGAFR